MIDRRQLKDINDELIVFREKSPMLRLEQNPIQMNTRYMTNNEIEEIENRGVIVNGIKKAQVIAKTIA